MDYKKELNEKQYEAVSSQKQYLRIIAGAGSGKTRVLTYRIAYLIEKLNVRPYEIVAITFTNKVAKEMKERTSQLLPNYNLTGLTISTFHSFCAKFLRMEIDNLGYPKNYTIYDDDDTLRLIKMIGAEKGYKKTDEIIKLAAGYISNKKMYGVMPSDVKLGPNPKEKTLLEFFKEYEFRKSEAFALDFDDLLIYAIKILRTFPEIRAHYASRFKHILVDEFQDTNDLQFELLKLLTNENTSVYVVGDPDQTIYTWRGANQRIILDIDKVFYPMETIILNENYRSTSKILRASNQLISHNVDRVKKDLFTHNGDGSDIVIRCLDTGISEANFIANTIVTLKNSNKSLKYSDIAILYRSSFLSLKIENALVTRGIPYQVYGGLKFYSRKEIKDALAYFRLFINDKDDVSFERICNYPKRGFGDKNLETLRTESRNANQSMYQYLRDIDNHTTELRPNIVNTMKELISKMDEVSHKLLVNLEAYSEILDQFLKDINFYRELQNNEEDDDKIENVQALIDDIRNYLKTNPDSNFEEYLQNVTLMTSQDEISGADNVSLMTIHTAKGLEFDYVFVMGFNDGVFPNARAINERTRDGLEEERRLAYVAFTRAKKQLYITLNRDYSYSSQSGNTPSRFIKEAGITLPSLTFMGVDIGNLSDSQSKGRNIYYYDPSKNSKGVGIYKASNKQRSNVVEINSGNGIHWSIGDICNHTVFGRGKVVKVMDDIIEVIFDDFGKKTLLGSHKSLSKAG